MTTTPATRSNHKTPHKTTPKKHKKKQKIFKSPVQFSPPRQHMVACYEKIDITSKNFLFVFVGFMCVYLVLGFCLQDTQGVQLRL